MGGETPATWGRAAAGSRSAGAFQGNMAGGGGGFSPEAQCGAAAERLTKEKLSEGRSRGCGGGGAAGGRGESLPFLLGRRPAEMLRSSFPRRPPAHLVERVF